MWARCRESDVLASGLGVEDRRARRSDERSWVRKSTTASTMFTLTPADSLTPRTLIEREQDDDHAPKTMSPGGVRSSSQNAAV